SRRLKGQEALCLIAEDLAALEQAANVCDYSQSPGRVTFLHWSVLGLGLTDFHRCTRIDECEEFRRGVRMQTYAPMRVRNRPNRAGMETVSGLNWTQYAIGYPSYVMIARARSLIARASDEAAPAHPETVRVGSLIADLSRHGSLLSPWAYPERQSC